MLPAGTVDLPSLFKSFSAWLVFSWPWWFSLACFTHFAFSLGCIEAAYAWGDEAKSTAPSCPLATVFALSLHNQPLQAPWVQRCLPRCEHTTLHQVRLQLVDLSELKLKTPKRRFPSSTSGSMVGLIPAWKDVILFIMTGDAGISVNEQRWCGCLPRWIGIWASGWKNTEVDDENLKGVQR